MEKNYFLTGKRQVGKSTLIKKAIHGLKLSPGGFMVQAVGARGDWRAFYLEDPKEVMDGQGPLYLPERCFAYRDTLDQWKIEPRVFDREGVHLLKKDLLTRDLVMMDELGRFEKDALIFQEKVHELLTSTKIVLGVLKDEKNPFLDSIRERKDVKILTVTWENQREILKGLLTRLSQPY